MEQPQEQLKRGLTRAVLKHGWLPRLCSVAKRPSLDAYLRPHPINSFPVSDLEIHSTSDLTRRISQSHSHAFVSPRENDNQSLVTPLPWHVLKNTAIPSVADLLRRTCPINLPFSSRSAPNFPGAGAANSTTSNGSGTQTELEENQIGSPESPTTASGSEVRPTGSDDTSFSTTQPVESGIDAATEAQVHVVHTDTQSEETQTRDAGAQIAQDVLTIGIQCKQNTSDQSTETVNSTSNAATQCTVEVANSEVQATKEHDTRLTQCTPHTAEIGIQTRVSTKSKATGTGAYIYTSAQCELHRPEGRKDYCPFKNPRETSADTVELADHIVDLVQQYSNKINSEVAAFSQDELTKKRLIDFLETLKRPTQTDTLATEESCVHQKRTNDMQTAGQMSPQSVTNLRRYMRDSFTDSAEANNDNLSTLSVEGPPSAFGVPEEADESVEGIPQGTVLDMMAIGPEEGRSEAQPPPYRLPPPIRSQKRYQQHQPVVAENPQATTDEPAVSATTDKAVSLYDDGTGIRVPNTTVPIVQETHISWRLKPDGTCHILGRGSFGCVAAATLRRPDGTTLDVAVKKYRFERDRRSFVREGKMGSFLSDTGVFPEFCGFLHLGPQNNPVICLVSELYGNGTTLDDVIVNDNLGSLRSWMSVSLQLAEGLRKIHEKNVIFNDLKANNILLNISRPDEPVVKFIDLGMSSYIYGITYNFTLEELANVPHLAPEVKLKGPTSILSDIWALGVTYWDMAHVSRLPGLKEVSKAALKDNPEERISLEGITDTLVSIGRCHQFL